MQAYSNGTAKGYILGGSYVMPYDYESNLALAIKDKYRARINVSAEEQKAR